MSLQYVWQFALLGIGSAAVYAILGYSVTINYKATGFVSFANGAVAMLAAYEFLSLRQLGVLIIPIPGISGAIHVAGQHVSMVPAAALAIVSAAAIGALSYVLVFRWLRTAPPLARMVASVGLMITLQALAVLKFGTNGYPSGPLVTQSSFDLFGGSVSVEQLGILALAAVLAGSLFWLYHYTAFGLKTTASAENPIVAALCGFRPIRLEFGNWLISSLLCGLAGVVATSFIALDPSTYTLLIVPALAVAVSGSFATFGISLLVSLALAVLQSEATGLAAQYTWFPQQGIPDILPFVFIVVILMVRGNSIPNRGSEFALRLPAVGAPARIGLATVVWIPIGILMSFLLTGQFRVGFIESLVSAELCLSVVVVTGLLGQVSVAQMSVAGFGAFVLAHVLSSVGLPAPVALICAGLAGIPLGVAAAVPALRIRGLQLAIVTLSLAVGLDGLLFSNTTLSGGFAGLSFPPPHLFGLNLGIQVAHQPYPRIQFALFAVIVTAFLAALVANVRRQPFGRQMLLVRASERIAAANAISASRVKLMGFALASFVAGLAGAMVGYEQTILTADSFSSLTSLTLLATAFLGGVGYISGAITAGIMFGAAGLMFTVLNYLVNFNQYQTLVVGLGVIITAILNPDGAISVPIIALRERMARFTNQRTSAALKPTGGALSARELQAETAVLDLQNFTVSYGGVPAVANVTLTVAPREILGLIGPNGAGKTSLLDGITGFTVASGRVTLDAEAITNRPAYRITRAGLARTFQSDELLADATVLDNVAVGPGAERGRWAALIDLVRPREPSPPQEAVEALEFVGLLDDAHTLVSSLDPRRRKLLGIARALAHRPKLLLLDEPAAGLDTNETAELAALVRRIRDIGIAMIVIDHDMEMIIAVSDRLVVLEHGQVIAQGAPDAVLRSDAVVNAYLGPSGFVGAGAATAVV